MDRREPIIARGGLFRLAYVLFAIWACREFALWLDPIIATAMGRDISAVRLDSPAKSQDRISDPERMTGGHIPQAVE